MDFSYFSPPLSDLTSLTDPSASVLPTRPVWSLYNRVLLLDILVIMSLALWMPNTLVSKTWDNTRGLSEFQVMLSTSYHSVASIYANRRPTAPGDVAY